jgi:hypothetical protein
MTKMLTKVGIAVLFFLVSNLVLALDAVPPVANAEEVRAVLFTNAREEKCFLSPEEVHQFSLVLTHLKRRTNPPGVSHMYFIKEDFLFYYWVFSEKKWDLQRLVTPFYLEGSSSMYDVPEEDKKVIQTLYKQLLTRAK